MNLINYFYFIVILLVLFDKSCEVDRKFPGGEVKKISKRQTADYNEGGLPRHLPSPPEKKKAQKPKEEKPKEEKPKPSSEPSSTITPLSLNNEPQSLKNPFVFTPNLNPYFRPMFPFQNSFNLNNHFLNNHHNNHNYGLNYNTHPYPQSNWANYNNAYRNYYNNVNSHSYHANHEESEESENEGEESEEISSTTENESDKIEETTTEKVEETTTEKAEPDPPAPFGLDETILIIVPQVKYRLRGFPKWCGGSVSFSFPITMFFEEMDWPTPPPPFGPNNTKTQSSKKSYIAPPRQLSHFPYTGGTLHHFYSEDKLGYFHTHKRRDVSKEGQIRNDQSGGTENRDEIMRMRRSKRGVMSLPPGDVLRGGERATIIPKVERTISSLGIGDGRHCLLRAVCEVHESQLHESYGLLGQLLTTLFTISRSEFAESHLPGYLDAENNGKIGNCSTYAAKCQKSLFFSNNVNDEKVCSTNSCKNSQK